MLPRSLADRLGSLLTATSHADEGPGPVTPETGILLTVAEAAVRRRPLTIGYRDQRGRVSRRVLRPYGVVALRGRWYATGLDSRSAEVRSFRLDRVTSADLGDGQFTVPDGFDPARQVTEAATGAAYRHAVTVRVQGTEQQVRSRLRPLLGGTAEAGPAGGHPGWTRARWRAERPDWVPGVLAGLGLPFVIEEPDELRERVRELAGRLTAWADAR